MQAQHQHEDHCNDARSTFFHGRKSGNYLLDENDADVLTIDRNTHTSHTTRALSNSSLHDLAEPDALLVSLSVQ